MNRISSRHARWRSRPERARALGAKGAKERRKKGNRDIQFIHQN
ncbi:MAG: hypothetical protein QNJ36_21420 [Calothrix sp. MO_167.B42]|nr:hypothetical protein [Calothrix sp. MO_167.B42]